MIEDDPARRAKDRRCAQYKTPVFINSNIHGNEWEGTDAALQRHREARTAPGATAGTCCAPPASYFNVTPTPTAGSPAPRANAAGFDLNRDIITASQPEARAMRRRRRTTSRLSSLDLHG